MDYATFYFLGSENGALADIQYMPAISQVNYSSPMATIPTKYIKFPNDLSRAETNQHRHEGRFRLRHNAERRLNHGVDHIAQYTRP